jgi:site-specific recombinase XerD
MKFFLDLKYFIASDMRTTLLEITKLSALLLTMQISNASVERSLRALKNFHTYLCSKKTLQHLGTYLCDRYFH